MAGGSSSIVVKDWQSSAEGETILQLFYNPHTTGRKVFGILERPSMPAGIEEVSYKLFMAGKSGVGKSATIARLSGTKCPSTYVETSGIVKLNIYWPVKIWNKIILFKLQFWDAGNNSIKKYSYFLPACKEKADAIVYVFSFLDNKSLSDLPKLMSQMSEPGQNPTSIAIGTRCNVPNRQVTSAETKEFQVKWNMPVLKIDNSWAGGRNEAHEVAPLLNAICERLWIRDQEYLLASAKG